jgi:hypothetical protein
MESICKPGSGRKVYVMLILLYNFFWAECAILLAEQRSRLNTEENYLME